MKFSIDLNKLTLFPIGDYKNTEFYPKNHVIASGEFTTKDIADKNTIDVSINIMKVNETYFTAMGANISSAEECRRVYKTDAEMDEDYYEELNPETFLVSMCYEDKKKYKYKTHSFITENIITISDIYSDKEFNEELMYEVCEMQK